MRISNNLKTSAPLFLLFIYWIFLVSGIDLSFPIQVIPDETAQLLNIYGMINSGSLKLPYETYYTVWVHLSFLPFTILFWGFEYFIEGMPSMAIFKTHVAANYIDVLPFLRSVSSILFLFSAWLVSKVIADKWGQKAAYLFLCFLVLDLLVFINLHYSKHWIIDFAWVFLSIYLYWNYLKNGSNALLILSGISLCFAMFSSHPLALAGLYHLYLLIDNKGTKKEALKDIGTTFSIVLIFFVLTMWLGPGKILSEIVYGGASSQVQASISPSVIIDVLSALVDYNFVLSAIFIFSVFYMILKRDSEIFLLIIPFIGYLFLIATYHFEPRYNLFLIISMSLISAVVLCKIKRTAIVNTLSMVLVFVNIILLLSWHSIVTAKDTRIMTLEWLKENTSSKSFVIYNTLGFNYYPITKDGIKFIDKNFPNAIGTREKLHLSLNLPDGINGIILRKIEEGRYKGPKLIKLLLESGYEPILTNERFGFNAYFHQPAPTTYEMILNNCSYTIESTFIPYDEVPEKFEDYGDILYNFTGVIKSLLLFDRPGPVMTIYRFNQMQPKTCS